MLKSSWPTRGVLVPPICEELCMETHPLLRGSTSTTPRAHLYSPAVLYEVTPLLRVVTGLLRLPRV